MSDVTAEVERHYGRGGLLDRILAALKEAGKDIDHLTIDDLAPIDELHSRRRQATKDLASMLAPKPGERVLDIGSGLGGPARYLAKVCGCRVTGIDLTAEFVATAADLTRRAGLAGQVDFQQASALDLPFPDASFDLAWSQNVAMNIADRPRYYAEMRRVLVPGGRLAIQDVAQGPGGPPHYPVMWADTPATSFLRTPEETRTLLEAAGLQGAGLAGQHGRGHRRDGGRARPRRGRRRWAAGPRHPSRGGPELLGQGTQRQSQHAGAPHSADQRPAQSRLRARVASANAQSEA